MLSSLGRYEEAEELFRQTWETLKDTAGPDHSNTLTVENNLAHVLIHLERFEEAEELHRHVWVMHKEALGPDHIDTLKSQASLAILLIQISRAEEARIYNASLGQD